MGQSTQQALLSTLLSLVARFQHESAAPRGGFETFVDWLDEHQHPEIKHLLATNAAVAEGVRRLLDEDPKHLLEQLARLDDACAHFASGLEGLAEIAVALNPHARLSAQAISLLRQVDASGGSHFIELVFHGGRMLEILDGSGGEIELTEPRFITDDLHTLVELRLLHHEIHPSGDNLYLYTRAAARLVASGGDSSLTRD
ncbi:MAG: hypothetical protein EOM91_05800 [Sphingobacteriia bacterium]|nr:hypothetical protein [Sphingobacteriia bacterium]NCC40296.1 hypothetical protein [Gammaproteobacteria bacterium]